MRGVKEVGGKHTKFEGGTRCRLYHVTISDYKSKTFHDKNSYSFKTSACQFQIILINEEGNDSGVCARGNEL